MRDGEFLFTAKANGRHPAESYSFGDRATSGIYLLRPMDVTFGETATSDAQIPFEDATRFGRDYRGATTLTMEFGVDNVDDPHATRSRNNMARVGEFRRVWQADALRNAPGVVGSLFTRNHGVERVLYGRPRRFAIAETKHVRGYGWSSVICDFVAQDDKFYEPIERSATATIGTGGTVPFYVPGNAKAWGRTVIYGPIAQPTIEVVGAWSYQLNVTIPAGSYIEVDPNPWRRTVRKNDGVESFAGTFAGWSSRQASMWLLPGPYTMKLTGTGTNGNTKATINWHDAYTYL